ncbi:DUF2157 domain-containing protein [Microbulbifer sp. OS29]|uniref:DUF2157 domain-containing protein n=1 Tax=Microbulbifer okhotskensis TaxID=2926617 RepID=A0A9X2J4R9_9GAMM|nr:DUF2157 domain-containing protein [Microbulbifer okhotskensis]MCO1334408.1 DUF2157 domain-containing protein [Microbulbifer okhotskensis]
MRLIRLLKHDLAREAGDWVEDGVISETQAEQICTRYQVDYHRVQQRTLGYSVLMGLAYLFIGLAVITLIGANWDEIPRALRMGGLIVLTMATQAMALKIYVTGDRRAGEGLLLLGNLFFGAAIILIAQIYHLGEHMPDGIFWWALGCLPFALITRSPWIAGQALILALLWFFLEISMGFYPAVFPVFLLSALFILTAGRSSVVLLLVSLFGLGFWLEFSLAEFWRVQDGKFSAELYPENLAVAVALFILMYLFGQWLVTRVSVVAKDYAAVISIWCLRFALISLLIFSFEPPWKALIEAQWGHLLSMWVVIAIMGAVSLLLALLARKLFFGLTLYGLFALVLAFVTNSGSADHAVWLQIFTNLTLIACGTGLILKGIHDGISHYFFLGVLAILLTALLRYIDLIGDYIGAAMLFILFAALLLGAAKYWKHQQAKERAR